MNRTPTHHLSYATVCRNTGHPCKASLDFIDALSHAIACAEPVSADDFCIEGFAALNGCHLPCVVGWKADLEKAYLFGDVPESRDLGELVRLAQVLGRYSSHQEGPRLPTAVPPLMLVIDLNLDRRAVA